ncbi:MAG: hypothetical protein RIS45_340 [Planctomycetota bacterium]
MSRRKPYPVDAGLVAQARYYAALAKLQREHAAEAQRAGVTGLASTLNRAATEHESKARSLGVYDAATQAVA